MTERMARIIRRLLAKHCNGEGNCGIREHFEARELLADYEQEERRG